MIGEDVVRILPINMLVPHYLVASYCYYHLNQSPMTDHAYDLLCVRLRENYRKIEHQHKELVEFAALRAGSCFIAMDAFPLIIQMSADSYMSRALSGEMATDLTKRYGAPQTTRMRRTRPIAPVTEEKPATTRIRRVRPAPAPSPEPPETSAPRIRRVRPSV